MDTVQKEVRMATGDCRVGRETEIVEGMSEVGMITGVAVLRRWVVMDGSGRYWI